MEKIIESPPMQRVKIALEVTSEASESSSLNSQEWEDQGKKDD